MTGMFAAKQYLESAAQSASPIGLTILLYDRLVTDLRKAMGAIEEKNIEKCCEYLGHGFLILGHLEAGLNMQDGGDTAKSLAQFYSYLRAQMLEAQVKQSTETLEKQISLILNVRNAWQQVESSSSKPQAPAAEAVPSAWIPSGGDEVQSSSWTA